MKFSSTLSLALLTLPSIFGSLLRGDVSATPMKNCVFGEDYIALQKCYENCLVPCALMWDDDLNVYESCCLMPGKKVTSTSSLLVGKTQCGFWEATDCAALCSTDCYKHIDEKSQQLEYCCGSFGGDDDNHFTEGM